MATASDLLRVARSLAGTHEAPHFDRTALKVARTYATLAADGLTANLRLAPEEQEFACLMAPEAFAPVPGGWGRMGWTALRLDAVDEDRLRQALETAWRHALPKARRPR
jgi:hypothetical protein